MPKHPLLVSVTSQKAVIFSDEGQVSPLTESDLPSLRCRPFLKWAGGKQWLSRAASSLAPCDFSGRYFEPFLGGGAFFFSFLPERAVLGDANHELIAAYSVVRDKVNAVIDLLSRTEYSREAYYSTRASSPDDVAAQAARLIYLNRTCWNGLYRVNRSGEFNVPFGRFPNPTICDENRLRAAGHALRCVDLRCGDFETSVSGATLYDFVYLDPPYITGHSDNGFLKYNAHLFSWADQCRMARMAMRLRDRGVHVLASNADAPQVVSLYTGFYYYRAMRRSLIAGAVDSRGNAAEALLSTYPLMGCESEVIE